MKELLQIDTALQFLVKEFEEIASGWNGSDDRYVVGGVIYAEEHATSAVEIIEKAQELRALLDEYNDL